jgi:thymidylate synthase (FAD)
MSELRQELIGKRVNVLDKGWIELVDLMPHPASDVSGDLAIVNAARVSFLGESKGEKADKKLLFYLLRNYHTSPFEMVEFKFRVRCPLITSWQWVRHRTWNINGQCLDGDTEIIFDKPTQIRQEGFRVGSKVKIKDLFNRWEKNEFEKNRIKQMNLRTVNEESMLLESAKVGNVVYAGEKDGFRIRTDDGREIVCSADHRFLFEAGWQTLKDATGLKLFGDRVAWEKLPKLYVNGKPLETADLYTSPDWLKYQYHTRALSISEIAELAQCTTYTIRKYLRIHKLTLPERSKEKLFPKGNAPWNDGLSYSLNETVEQNLERRQRARKSVPRGEASNFWKGGVSKDRENIGRWTTDIAAYIFKRDKFVCAFCGNGVSLQNNKLHAHHIVPVWADESKAYDEDNLVTVHDDCHRFIHANHLELEFAQRVKDGVTFSMERKREIYAERDFGNGKSTPHLVQITSIEYVGKREMYDLVVDGKYPNFIANWFVVHNSGRYTPFEEDDFYVPSVWRKQSKDNKQASEGEVTDEEGRTLTEELVKHYDEGFRLYQKALDTGVSREMARLFLPGFSVYYTWVLKIDAHNLMHFLRLRMANDAQYEIRVYAQAIYEHFFKPALPWTAEAFEEYVLNKQD